MRPVVIALLAVAAVVVGEPLGFRRIKTVGDSSDRRVVCYYGSWAVYRPDLGKFDVENIDPYLCTHVIYTFAGLDETTDQIYSLDPYNDLYDNYGKGAYVRFTNLALTNPDLKCILAIGGWNEGSTKYSNMANDPTRRATFVASVVPYLKQYGFVGLDVDWEYPTQRGGVASDRQAFVDLLSDLRAAFEPEGLLLSAAVSAGQSTIDAAYDVPQIVQYVDYLNVMAYDYHGSWETVTGHNAPLHKSPQDAPPNDVMNVEFSANYWLQLGAPADKINLGLPTYGHNFALADLTNTGLYAPTYGPGDAGPYTRQAGTLGYNEMCVDLQQGGWAVTVDPYYLAPYASKGNQWVGYDDPTSIGEKCNFINSLGLGGAMIWSIETDDFQPTCGSDPFPILKVINQYIRGDVTFPPPATTTPYTGPSTTTTPSPTQPPPPPSDICQHAGYQADPNDCTTFYNCVPNGTGGWTVYTFHCGAGTVFDPSIDSCNYPENVPDCHADI